MRTLLLFPCLLALLSLNAFLSAADWLRFRGPNGSATSTDTQVPTRWSGSDNVLWKLDLPGRGFSSPILVAGKVFVTAYTGGTGDLSSLKRQLICADRQTGKVLWSREVPAVLPEFVSRGGMAYHGYASHTPVSDGERVFAFFGTTGVVAFDLNGKQLWKQSVGKETNARFGSSASPIVHKNLVIVPACSESVSVRALGVQTGKEVWKAEGESLANCYSTPIVVTNSKGEEELLLSVTNEIWSLNPLTGKLRWYASTLVDTSACTSLVTHEGVVYVVGGRSGGRTAVKIGGKDDVTQSNVLWSKRGGSYVPSPVFHEGHLYWVNDRGILSCVNAQTGEEVNKKRLDGTFYASLVLAGNKLYAVSRFNGTFVVEANPQLTDVAHNKLGDESDFSASAAISDQQLFLRSDKALYCIARK